MVASVHTRAALVFTVTVACLMLLFSYPFVCLGIFAVLLMIGYSYFVASSWDSPYRFRKNFSFPPPPPLYVPPPPYMKGYDVNG
jgi:hypothetical protein